MDTQSQEHYPLAPSLSPTQPQASAPAPREDCSEAVPSVVRAEMPPAVMDPIAPITVMPVTLTSSPAPAVPAPPPGLPPLVQATAETSKLSDTKDIPLKAGTERLITPNSKLEPQALFRKSPTTVCQTVPATPKTWKKPNEGSPVGDASKRETEVSNDAFYSLYGGGHTCPHALRQTAKRQYRTKIESYYPGSNARQMWQGLQTIRRQKEAQSRAAQ
ncbi:unnamed protein product [Oncorhynchus mykiss]|uniref:Uncharacterized protein n=1 Tax=Oncorhynchus mykiss TaxID=8022 RepID=A0A060Z093_ONCMY|nr:unnamed protein product [Oncorhynchus mykiss]